MVISDPTQLIGILACFLSLNACLKKDEKQFKLSILFSCLLWAAHNAMLGAQMAAVLSLVAAVRTAMSFDLRNRKYMVLLLTIYLALALWDKNSPYDWLPIVATVLGTFAMFYCTGVRLRIVHCLGSPLWILHDVHYGSIGGVISQSTMLLFSILTICRMLDVKRRLRLHLAKRRRTVLAGSRPLTD